jgi:uncharacterized protein YaeQ
VALAPTLYDFQVALSNVDSGVQQDLSFKLARHPSERMERVWLKVMAFCWVWEERLTFGPGLGEPDAPDLETRDYTGLVTRWVRVGKGEPSKVQRAVDQNASAKVHVLFESEARLTSFLSEAAEAGLDRLARAELASLEAGFLAQLAAHEERRTRLTVTLSDDHFYVDCGGTSFDGVLVRGAYPAR